MSEEKSLKKQLDIMLKKAHRSIVAAERHMKDGDDDFASSKIQQSHHPSFSRKADWGLRI